MRCFAGPQGFVYILRRASGLSKMRHFGGCAPGGGYDPQIELGRDLCAMHLPVLPKFHHPMFTHSEVIVLTNKTTHKHKNKQTDSGENIQHSSLRYYVG